MTKYYDRSYDHTYDFRKTKIPSSARKLENMVMDQVLVVMAKHKPNWSESELLALSDAVYLTFQSSAVNLAQGQG